MGILSWWHNRGEASPVVVPPRESREVGKSTVTVEFDDKTVAQVNLTGCWSYWTDFHVFMFTGHRRAIQFIESKDPIQVGNGYSYPRHRVSRYHTVLGEYQSLQDDKSTIDIIWPIPMIGES